MFALFLSLVALGFTQDTYHKDEAHRFCKKQGGTVFTFGLYTSPPPYGLLINEHMEVCSIPRTDNGSPFLVPLETLTNPLPSLAVLAFNAKIPRMFVISSSYCEAKAFDPNGDIASPAGVYCAELGGSTAGHLIAYGGVDWYKEETNGEWTGNAYDFCVFPDFSAIGDWTLAYHAVSDLGDNIQFAWTGPPLEEFMRTKEL